MPSSAAAAKRLPRPATVSGRWLPIYAVPILTLHAVALLAFVPWLFSWTGLIVMIVGVHLYGCMGINLCYHRLLAHRSLRVPKWFEHALVVFAQCSMQDTPVKWVCNHRMHHLHSDEQPDPHSPMVSFFWSHFDWLLKYNSATRNISNYQKYARDLLEDPFYMYLEKNYVAPLIYAAHALAYYVVGFIAGFWHSGGSWLAALQFGLSLLLWGAIVRTVAVWHITWSVNSLTHLFGYQSYETNDNSRNNWFVAIVATGEGWHNNHHHDQAAATVQHRWWEIDICYWHILILKWLGLATHIVPPAHKRRRNAGSTDLRPTPLRGEPSPSAAASTVESPL
jgi:fatty-acid desaturase